ncbi:glutamate racemase [Aquimarina sp. 2201CG14-23]|uniref:glutamate racemase n=1 Tax=Aquimarina mycalae TaxID=3040073 RepID=UPI002477D05F|nr:glutamate racemase [Aquimarina sp. 2201CG14-23]MDH7445337.1 glutamate racemase [Aquimarina sp. 2201CG14-23]
MDNKAIGIFDSGVGGTSIWKEIAIALPNENTIYLADSKYAPYGKRNKDEIIALSIKNTKKLLELNSKIVVVACNTATTNAIKVLREQFDVPFIGIEPAIKPAALNTKTQKVGVLATKGTLSSELFAKTSDLYANTIEVIEVIGTGLVELIEKGSIHTPEMIALLESYIQPLIQKNIDYLVLGCSHYPYLIPTLRKMLPKHIIIIDSGEAVAKQTGVILSQNDLLSKSSKKGTHTFFTNGTLDVLQQILKDSAISSTSQYLKF